MSSIVSNLIIKLNKLITLIAIFLLIEVQGVTEVISLQSLTLDEKIGQLFIIPASQLLGKEHIDDLQSLIREGKAGGILLKQGTAQGQRDLIEELQEISPLPLLCLQDGEYGVAMRLSDVISFPRNLTLGAVQDLSLLYQLGQKIGRQCALVGTHINLAPVVDVNSNPLNPIIHMRSFGEDPFQVALRGEMVMRGMQSMGIFACAKHFPGHGDTSVDSHIDLPFVEHDRMRLEKVELFPFQWLIQAGVKSVMSAHLYVNALAESALLPATFSSEIITTLLQEELGFNGLIISDALNMGALAKSYAPGEIAINTLLAGHDLLLYGDHIAPKIDQILRFDLPEAFRALKAAVENQEISEELIDARVSKIIHAKRDLGLFEKSSYKAELINSHEDVALKKRLFEEAITVIRNERVLPLTGGKIAIILETGNSQFFKAVIEEHLDTEVFFLTDPQLLTKIQQCSCAVIALSNLTDEEALLRALEKSEIPIVAVVFGSPYSVAKLPLFSAIVIAYENEKEAQEAAAEVILGRLPPKGRLPVSIQPFFTTGTGLSW